MFDSQTHRVAAPLTDNDSVRKSLIVNLNMEGPVSAVQRVFLDEVQIIHTGDLHAEETKKATIC